MTRATSPTPLRRTKIVATLGPASDRPGVLEAMLKAGVDVVRATCKALKFAFPASKKALST